MTAGRTNHTAFAAPALAPMTDTRQALAALIEAADPDGGTSYKELRAALKKAEAALSAQPVAGAVAQPDGYAYRYHDGIRFNGGIEVNGSKPIEAIPFFYAPQPQAAPAPEPSALAVPTDEEVFRFQKTNNERPAFESWAKRKGMNLQRDSDMPGTYAYDVSDAAWAAWETRAALAASPQPEPSAEPTPYQQRAIDQGLKWVAGESHHNAVDNECCPDFSCCNPSLFERDRAKRVSEFNAWARQHGHPQLIASAPSTPPHAVVEAVPLMRGVRVDGETVVISVKGGNDAARKLCGELVALIERRRV